MSCPKLKFNEIVKMRENEREKLNRNGKRNEGQRKMKPQRKNVLVRTLRISASSFPLMKTIVLGLLSFFADERHYPPELFFAPSCLYCRPPSDVMTCSLPRRVSTAALPLM